MSEFKRLSIEDAAEYFGQPDRLVPVPCPACGSETAREVWKKHGFTYNQCESCRSVFVSPRPTAEALEHYYAHSRASRYRVEHLARDTAKARRNHLIRSNANWMGRLVDEIGNPQAREYTDIGSTLPQVFEEIRDLGLFDRYHSLHPLPALERECEAQGASVTSGPLSGQGAVTAFEVLEHQFSPLDFLKNVASMLAEGGIFFFTSRTSSGFDLQILWDKVPYIFVPEHLNLLSIEGLQKLLERAGLDLVELSTPGQLDLQMVEHAAKADPEIQLPGFFRYLLKHRDEEAHEDFQSFLQKHRLSSHVRVAAKKKDAAAG
jgi:hypothetical protein